MCVCARLLCVAREMTTRLWAVNEAEFEFFTDLFFTFHAKLKVLVTAPLTPQAAPSRLDPTRSTPRWALRQTLLKLPPSLPLPPAIISLHPGSVPTTAPPQRG